MSLFNLSIAYRTMRTERDNALGEEALLRDLIADHFMDSSEAAREWLEEIAKDHRKMEAAERLEGRQHE